MATIQVKHVPDDVHAELRRRADAAGQSLQEYLLKRLSDEARRPTLDDVLERAGGHTGGWISFEFAVGALGTERRG
jgi:plasmid stability protein